MPSFSSSPLLVCHWYQARSNLQATKPSTSTSYFFFSRLWYQLRRNKLQNKKAHKKGHLSFIYILPIWRRFYLEIFPRSVLLILFSILHSLAVKIGFTTPKEQNIGNQNQVGLNFRTHASWGKPLGLST